MRVSPALCSVVCLVCIDRAVFASIEDSDSDPDHHGEDSSSNTSADDHMSTKRSHCCLRGGGVKEVRGSGASGPKGVANYCSSHAYVAFMMQL